MLDGVASALVICKALDGLVVPMPTFPLIIASDVTLKPVPLGLLNVNVPLISAVLFASIGPEKVDVPDKVAPEILGEVKVLFVNVFEVPEK